MPHVIHETKKAMKKIFFTTITLISLSFVLFACSRDDSDEQSAYTDKQRKVFALFNGVWADYQFSKLGGGIGDPDLIVFGQHYTTPIRKTEKDYLVGEIEKYEAQGECMYRSYNYGTNTYDDTHCFYYVNANATYLALYDKATNKRFKGFDMYINSETSIRLHDKNLSLPYVFQKQK